MKIELRSKPKPNPIIIDGFPGFGFVSTIAAEYLVEHLDVKSIGRLWSEELQPYALIHGNRVFQPLEIFYSSKYNIVVLEAVAGVQGLEWEAADALLHLYTQLGAKEIISLEGIQAPPQMTEPEVFFYSNHEAGKTKLATLAKPMQEGIVFGVSGALMVKETPKVKSSFIFASAHSDMPDSRAAAKLLEVLNKYIGINIDTKPLLKKASEFESQLKNMLTKAQQAGQTKQSKDIVNAPYIG